MCSASTSCVAMAWAVCVGLDDVMEDLVVRPIATKRAERIIMTRHYALRIPQIMHAFGLVRGSELLGVVTYGIPANCSFSNLEYPILELNRLVLLHNRKNEASFLIANSLRQIPTPHVVVSYADTAMGHIGCIYQATNWIYTGESASRDKFKVFGDVKHSKTIFEKYGTNSLGALRASGVEIEAEKMPPKHRYFYPLPTSKKQKKQMTAWIDEKYGIKPYPKGDTQRYNIQDIIDAKPKKPGGFGL